MANENDGKMVLVVEDDDLLSKAICARLKQSGFSCSPVTTAEEAWTRLREKVDLIWLDIYLPGMSGVEFLEKLRKDDHYKDIPVMVVTCSSGAANRTRKQVKDHNAEFFIKNDATLEILASKAEALINGEGAGEKPEAKEAK